MADKITLDVRVVRKVLRRWLAPQLAERVVDALRDLTDEDAERLQAFEATRGYVPNPDEVEAARRALRSKGLLPDAAGVPVPPARPRSR